MTTLNTTTLAQVQISQVIEQLNDYDTEALIGIYNQYADAMSYERIYDNDEDTINDLYQDASDALRAAFYGDYNHSHNYLTLNGYANLESFDYVTDDNCPIDIEDLAQWISNNEIYNDFDIEVATLDDMLASIEDNITDDEDMLHRLSDYLSINLNDKDKDNFSSFDHFILDSCLSVISDYDYSQLNDIITHLNINYK